MQQKVLWAEVQKETGREEPVEDPGPTCRREVWAGGTNYTSSRLQMWGG